MKRETLLTLAVVALLVLNIGILAYLFMSRRPDGERAAMPPGGNQFDELVITQLRLNAAQQEQFKSLKHQHRSAMQGHDTKYRDVLGQYFALLRETRLDTARRDSLQRLLTDIHGQKISMTLQHFLALKNICSPEQQSLFERLIPELSRVLTPPPRRVREGAPEK
jgi:hypothetical protein